MLGRLFGDQQTAPLPKGQNDGARPPFQQETGRPMFDSAVKQLSASGAGVNLNEVGHGEESKIDPNADPSVEKAKALAKEEGISFMAAYSRILNQED